MFQPVIVPLPTPSEADLLRVRDLTGAGSALSDHACRALYYRGYSDALCDNPSADAAACWASVESAIQRSVVA